MQHFQKLLFLSLLLLLPTPNLAAQSWDDEKFTPAQMAEFYRAFNPIKEARDYAAASLPPCEGLDRISNATFKHEPPAKLCPKAHAAYDKMERYDRHLRDFCHDVVTWAEKNLKNEPQARTPEKINQAKLELRTMKIGMLGDWDSEVKLDPASEFNDDLPEDISIKESDDMRCFVAISVVMQYRKDALSLTQHHTSKAESALEELPEHPDAAKYFNYLRYGDNGEL